MTAKVFEAALGIGAPWSVGAVEFDEATKVLTVPVDFKPGTRFKVSGQKGLHPVHDTVVKTYRHLNFFQHECYLKVRTPRVKLGDGSVRLVEPDFAGRLSGFTLLFEALVLMLSQQMPFAAVARIVGESAYRCMQVCNRYVEMALEQADFSDVTSLAIDETSRARGHDYVTLAADAQARRVIFVTEGRDAKSREGCWLPIWQLMAALPNRSPR
ncbi:transposase [Xanthomonas oryzae pv. oryzae KACC 10331]|uniref:Transposase n=1 Tax=Xanthomonas oryzae pv. oryzae (strain KACC10331 / KXO85) TaxID=291331 RepID=Q5GYB1_XANOR|nr:transposase [Xanthomonas oryzae pv. oryzae KACC 10331]